MSFGKPDSNGFHRKSEEERGIKSGAETSRAPRVDTNRIPQPHSRMVFFSHTRTKLRLYLPGPQLQHSTPQDSTRDHCQLNRQN